MIIDSKNFGIKAIDKKNNKVFRVIEIHLSKTCIIDKLRVSDGSNITNFYSDNSNNRQISELDLSFN
jgi:hypothetical protein